MSRASTKTKLPLALFAKYLGMHPLHVNQVRIDGADPHCGSLMFQHEWQNADHVSREEVARAIAEAESKIEAVLGYRLAPTWEVDEWQPTIKNWQPEYHNIWSSDIRGMKQFVRADWGHLISGGIQAKDLVEAGAAITWSDADGDGINDTATVTVPTVALDPSEIAIFYPGESGDDAWEIRPIEVSIVSNNAIITFKRELVVIPEKLNLYDIEGGEALYDEDADFLDEVDVYRRYNDPQTQVSFLWEPKATGWCGVCNGEGCSICSYTTQSGCLILRDNPRQSLVGFSPASWDSDEDEFTTESWAIARQPDLVRLYYYAGWRDKSARYTNRISEEWGRTVAYFAASLLDRPSCDCSADVWNRWRQDLALDSGDEDGKPIFRTPSGVLDNPFGSTRGAINAWRKVQPLIRSQAVLL